MQIDINNDVLPKLRRVTKTGNGWTACCPAHNDEKPSLSIKVEDEKVLFKCFVGCSYSEIVHALGIFEREQSEQRRIVATYDYVDENGHPLYQVVRYEPKDFRVRKPNGKGDWDWKLGDTKRVLYRLPEILGAREEDFYVIFCEGEKDADNVKAKLNFPATTIALGVNAWRDDYSDYLFGLNVVILPDNDKAGKDFAGKVAKSIYDKAQTVKIVQLPDLAEKADVSDWIENGGNREGLIELIEKTNDWQPLSYEEETSTEPRDFFVVKSSGDWIKEAKLTPIPKMLFGELWFESEICILFADTNAGKSILAVQIADSITKGKPIGHFPLQVEPQKVLYFDFELNARQFANRYAEDVNGYLANEYKFSEDFLRVAINPDAALMDGRSFEECLFDALESYLNETDVKILIVDNLTYLKSENEKAKDALPIMKRLKRLKEKYNLSIMALAHTPKRDLSKEITQNDLAGSKMLINFCDSSFAIGKSCKDESVRYVKQIKERNTGKIYGTENVAVGEVSKDDNFLSFRFFSFGNEKEHLKTRSNKDLQEETQQAKELESENKTQREIASLMGISLGKVNKLLNESNDVATLDAQDVQNVHPLFDMNNMNRLNETEKIGLDE